MRGSSDFSGRGGVAGATFVAALMDASSLPEYMKNASPGLQHHMKRQIYRQLPEGQGEVKVREGCMCRAARFNC